ncbi:MAG: MoxR family ATPase [Actinobacteria bacterium]|nr:MoxR family ATPase [Actinomycetota bacterium]
MSEPLSAEDAQRFAANAEAIVDNVAGFIQGKREVICLAVTCLLAEGHLLLEDVPGVGKTSLARSIAATLGMTWHRIQFTPDLLPSDVTGVSIFHQGSSTFEFHPGPVFAHIVLADEINRASPRTQSALLEVMEERTVTVDGITHAVPRPFLVLATQNPIEMDGTFPLPEAQLDRFLMSVSIGYPDLEAEVRVLANSHRGLTIEELQSVGDADDIRRMVALARTVHVEPAVMEYVVRLTSATRTAPGVRLGASPRGSVGLLRAAQVSAAMSGRTYVTPVDVQRLAVPVLAHRIVLNDVEADSAARTRAIEQVVAGVPAG